MPAVMQPPKADPGACTYSALASIYRGTGDDPGLMRGVTSKHLYPQDMSLQVPRQADLKALKHTVTSVKVQA